MTPREHVPLAERCTLGVGGAARYFVEADGEAAVCEALAWARRRGVDVRVMGGGSNLVVPDEGVDGLVIRIALRGVATSESEGGVEVTAAAGEPWDEVVRLTVERGWAGIECLSGIPGLVGATPIQNVGAYGQEVSETITAVRALDTRSGEIVSLDNAACGFGYRDSRLKSGEPERYIVLGVTYRLRRSGATTVRYADLTQHLAGRGIAAPTVADVRESVLAVRRAKSMVIEAGDPNRRSCGSFFTNPVVTPDTADGVRERAGVTAMPRWDQPDGRVKLSAAWLIERAGFTRGQHDGAVGISTRHALAIVAHDGARATDVLAFARTIAESVRSRFGVTLVPEPVIWSSGTRATARW
jgi:UDP-N-acetylmuramate dehydrogenase